MQKRWRGPGWGRLTRAKTRAYPNPYVSSTRRRDDVLLLPDAGVWVGVSEILPTHPAKAGGFLSSALEAGEPGRAGFSES